MIIKSIEDAYSINDQSRHSAIIEREIDLLIMIPRVIDMATPFCINRTYQGLIDEYFPIDSQEFSVS